MFLLIMGGGKKIYENYRKLKGGDAGKN